MAQATAGGTGLLPALQADIAEQLSAMSAAEKSSVVRAQIDTVSRLQKRCDGNSAPGSADAMES